MAKGKIISQDQRLLFALLRGTGLNSKEASRTLGIGETTGRRWSNELAPRIEALEERIWELASEHTAQTVASALAEAQAPLIQALRELAPKVAAKVRDLDVDDLPPKEVLSVFFKLLGMLQRLEAKAGQGEGKITADDLERAAALVQTPPERAA